MPWAIALEKSQIIAALHCPLRRVVVYRLGKLFPLNPVTRTSKNPASPADHHIDEEKPGYNWARVLFESPRDSRYQDDHSLPDEKLAR